jgi:hypothetical protein
LRPAVENCIDLVKNLAARLVSVHFCNQQAIVVRVDVTNVSAHRQSNRLEVEPLRLGASADAAGVLETGMLRDSDRFRLRTPRIEIANVLGEVRTIPQVE